MRKILLATAALFFVAALSGCSKEEQNLNETGASLQTEADQEQEAGDVVIGNVYDAMSSGDRMKCAYTTEGGEGEVFQSVVFVDGDMYKSISEFDGKRMYALFDGEAVYSWNDFSKQGTKIREGCFDEIEMPEEDIESKEQDLQDPKEMFDDAFNVKCEKADEGDFSLPDDVEFSDQCEFLKNQMQQMEQSQQTMPGGFELPEGVELPEGFEMPQE